ncbi:MAG: DUF6491 family protein [Aquisalinus sp.]|nr:DUF6491 family protein [Aquisalinus sp.]
MRKTLQLTALASTTCLLLTACASTDEERSSKIEADDPRLGEQVNRICFTRTIDNFKTVSDRQVILSASPSREYLVETGACFQLDRAQRIGLTDRGGNCLTRGDIILVSEDLFASRSNVQQPDRCFIRSMYEWDADATDEEDETEE